MVEMRKTAGSEEAQEQEPQPPPDKVQVYDPRSGEGDGLFLGTAAPEVARLAGALRKAQAQWQSKTVQQRAQLLRDWLAALAACREELLAALVRDTGRVRLAQLEIDMALERIAHWCDRAPALLRESPQGRARLADKVRWQQQRVPYPLVGVISPWNFPLLLALYDAIPALLAGCAVLIKPSEIAPRFIAPLRRSVVETPALHGVLEIIGGAATTGAELIRHVDAVCFTGSVATGRRVALAAAERLIPAFLELGGKDAALVLASADLERAVRAILRSAAGATGQACQSLERIYVERSVAEDFTNRLVRAAKQIRPNYPQLESGHLGPFIHPQQAAVAERHLADAVERGAHIHCGGKIERHGGAWLRPTVLTEVRRDMLVMREESFAPLLPVMPFDSVEEAVQLTNDSDYGLSAAVFAGTEKEALAVAEQLNAGAVCINDASLTVMVDDAERDAFACSGLGVSRSGDSSLLRFLRKKALLIQEGEAADLRDFGEKNAVRD